LIDVGVNGALGGFLDLAGSGKIGIALGKVDGAVLQGEARQAAIAEMQRVAAVSRILERDLHEVEADFEALMLRVPNVQIQQQNNHFTLKANASGEELNPDKHELVVDVKAVTLHRFRVEPTMRGWEATVILDI